jgi:HEAT repeat protein
MPLTRRPAGSPDVAAEAPDAAAILRRLAGGTDEERWIAARAAAELPSAVSALGEALVRETNLRVREAMFTALARIATPQSVEAVLPFLRSDHANVRTAAIDALVAMKEAAWPYLEGLLRDRDRDVRIVACSVVRNMPNETAVRLFCELLDSELEPNVCAAAIDALAEIGGPQALPALTRCAARFAAMPFLAFSIKVAVERIRSQAAVTRG